VDAFVWVESWQQQCCGDDFRVGSAVQWQVRTNSDADEWVELLLGAEWSAKVRFTEDHHMDGADGVLTGVVSKINVVTCERVLGEAPQPGPSGQVMIPVPGSGWLRDVEVADLWEPEPPDLDSGWSFDGWIVKLGDAQLEAGIDRTDG
jgi:hypothetical protein